MTVPARLRAPGLVPLWQALHDRFSSGRPVLRVTVTGLGPEHQAALADLLGLDRYPGPSMTIPVAKVEAALADLEVRAVVEEIAGPIGNRAQDLLDRRLARADLNTWFASHPVVTAEPALLELSLSRVDRSLLDQALNVIAALPASGRPLAAVANDITGDPHALDDGTRLSGLVLKALSLSYGLPLPDGAQSRRAFWERAGVSCDELSTTVLVKALRPTGTEPLARVLQIWGAEPSVVTLAQLKATPQLKIDAKDVWVTENPTILAMAHQRLGADCPPMVCTAGWPNSAVVRLLRTLIGVTLHYHGDFDGEGLRIAAYTMAKTGAQPWRMATADYLDALAKHPGEHFPGRITDAPWDPDLAATMRSKAVAVPEETVADSLIEDLDRARFKSIEHRS